MGGGGRYDVSPVGDIGFCESVPCVFFLNKKKQFPIIASLLENPLSGFHYPLMRRILCVIGLGAEMQKVIKIAELHFWPKKISTKKWPKNDRK